MNEQLIRIVLTIAGRQYPVKVEPNEEKAIRSIEKSINQKINEFQIHYKGKDKQDCITMAMLSIAFQQLKPQADSDLSSIDQKLTGIMELLDL